MTDPLFTVPVVGYRRWRMDWTIEQAPDDCECDSCHANLELNGQRGTHPMPALMPSGYQSTGEPWVPGRNDAVCSGKEGPSHTGFTFAVWANPATPPHFEPTRGAKPKHTAPDPNCKCGLYAMHTIDQALEALGPLRENEVLGAVVGWGAIEVHADGWRAEHAMVVGLATDGMADFFAEWMDGNDMLDLKRKYREQVRALAKRYGVPAVEMDELPLIAERYGQPLPDTAIPEQPTLKWAAGNSMIAGSPGHGYSMVPSYSMVPNVPTATPGAAFNAYLAEVDEQLAQAKRELAERRAQMDAMNAFAMLVSKRSLMQRLREHVAWHLHPIAQELSRAFDMRVYWNDIQRVRDRISPRRPGWPDLNRTA